MTDKNIHEPEWNADTTAEEELKAKRKLEKPIQKLSFNEMLVVLGLAVSLFVGFSLFTTILIMMTDQVNLTAAFIHSVDLTKYLAVFLLINIPVNAFMSQETDRKPLNFLTLSGIVLLLMLLGFSKPLLHDNAIILTILIILSFTLFVARGFKK